MSAGKGRIEQDDLALLHSLALAGSLRLKVFVATGADFLARTNEGQRPVNVAEASPRVAEDGFLFRH